MSIYLLYSCQFLKVSSADIYICAIIYGYDEDEKDCCLSHPMQEVVFDVYCLAGFNNTSGKIKLVAQGRGGENVLCENEAMGKLERDFVKHLTVCELGLESGEEVKWWSLMLVQCMHGVSI